MADITDLERRITAALDRVGRGLDDIARTQHAPPSTPDPNLIEELEVERATNERLIAAREKLTGQMERSEAKMDRLRKTIAEQEKENARLLTAIEGLQANNAALRDASGADDNATIESLRAELAEVKAARENDLAQLDEALTELQPLLKEA